ncbi:MAG: hypothetical protein HYR55_01210 [Acidobacteria bacterium]|nr:hypothetical protein [Acidobacteriota bacterium]MBI3655273.1 hypothetical protein [Acidobacteriota bacterium]
MREWTCSWNGIPIVVRSWTRWLRTGEELLVGGLDVDRNESGLLSRMSAHLAAPISVGGRRHNVEAILAQGQGTVRTCCKIHVDGQVVGGDIAAKLRAPEVATWEKVHEAGMLRYVFGSGLLRYGLPYAVMAAAISAPAAKNRSVWSIVIQWTIAGAMFGLAMTYFTWRSSESAFNSRQEKLRGEPKFAA